MNSEEEQDAFSKRLTKIEIAISRLTTIAEGAFGSEGVVARIKKLEETVTDLATDRFRISVLERDLNGIGQRLDVLSDDVKKISNIVSKGFGALIGIPILLAVLTFLIGMMTADDNQKSQPVYISNPPTPYTQKK